MTVRPPLTQRLVWYDLSAVFPPPFTHCGSCIHSVIDAYRWGGLGGGGLLDLYGTLPILRRRRHPCRAVCQPISCLLAYLKRCTTAEVCQSAACVADMLAQRRRATQKFSFFLFLKSQKRVGGGSSSRIDGKRLCVSSNDTTNLQNQYFFTCLTSCGWLCGA